MNANIQRFLKHYFLVLVGLVYFWIYFHYKHILVDYIKENAIYGEIGFGYFNAMIGAFMVYSIVTLFERWVEKFFHYIFSHFGNITLETIAKEFVIQFMDIFKFYGTIYIFFRFIHLPSHGQALVDKIASICLLIITIFFITTLIKIIFEKGIFGHIKSKTSLALLPFITKFISIFIWIVGIIVIIGNLGYNVSAIIAGAGIGGIAIALAAQKSLTNIFGAITIMLNRPFKIGDLVCINNFTGTVKDIGLSYLTIIDQMGHQVMIPNENIITSSIENLTEREYRRTEFIIGIAYSTTLDKLKKATAIIESILKEYASRSEITERYRATFNTFGASSLDIRVLYFSLINNDLRAYDKQKEKINLEIQEALFKAKIGIAYPTQELIIKEGKFPRASKKSAVKQKPQPG